MPPPPLPPQSTFQQQRSALISEIALSLENVLQTMNKLNRSLEGVIAVGNEFGSVEALWSSFEGVMATEGEEGSKGEREEEGGGDEDEEGDEEKGNDEGEDDTIIEGRRK